MHRRSHFFSLNNLRANLCQKKGIGWPLSARVWNSYLSKYQIRGFKSTLNCHSRLASTTYKYEKGMAVHKWLSSQLYLLFCQKLNQDLLHFGTISSKSHGETFCGHSPPQLTLSHCQRTLGSVGKLCCIYWLHNLSSECTDCPCLRILEEHKLRLRIWRSPDRGWKFSLGSLRKAKRKFSDRILNHQSSEVCQDILGPQNLPPDGCRTEWFFRGFLKGIFLVPEKDYLALQWTFFFFSLLIHLGSSIKNCSWNQMLPGEVSMFLGKNCIPKEKLSTFSSNSLPNNAF